jgi:hypothetical protein
MKRSSHKNHSWRLTKAGSSNGGFSQANTMQGRLEKKQGIRMW